MENPHDLARQLARALREGPDYQSYLAAWQELDETGRQMFRDYRRQKAKLQAALLAGQSLGEADLDAERRLAELVSLHGGIQACLQAQERVARLFEDVQGILGEALREWLGEIVGDLR
ncbi:MAG: YlbF family regulator [Thermaerobacter sp.]|nr:YlbF family regulator [Thermaerobacter sp.]